MLLKNEQNFYTSEFKGASIFFFSWNIYSSFYLSSNIHSTFIGKVLWKNYHLRLLQVLAFLLSRTILYFHLFQVNFNAAIKIALSLTARMSDLNCCGEKAEKSHKKWSFKKASKTNLYFHLSLPRENTFRWILTIINIWRFHFFIFIFFLFSLKVWTVHFQFIGFNLISSIIKHVTVIF